ncbi:serine/threonine-protein phosphatase 6 regulatory ankyrin repeat subunit A-like [Haliotis asinina]|uniref:serine/threonine-protein phosphatase 6 regulatory ankyrin repeat subunit A-like n=1 Tax=Haliotis asinina TaxID=109174 RepID=UPI00353236CD
MVAAVAGHRELLELLVEKGANLTLQDDEDNNILHVVCMEGNLETVKYIYSRKIIDIDSRGGNGTTPLMSAALFGKMDVFCFLMKIGADMSKENDDGQNILHVSCQGGNVEIVEYVIKHTCLYINSTDKNGITPLMLAAGYRNNVVFHFLIERGADTLAKDSTNRNVLHWASQGGNVKIVKYILTQNIIDINGNDDNKMTPLLLAAYHGNSDVLELLIEKGANALAVNRKSRNSLHLSCTGGHVDAAKYVLNQTSVDINSKDCEEMTPVMLAASHGKSEVFDMLIKKGADLSVIDKNGDNILHWACRGGNVKIVNYILMQNIVDINSKGYKEKTPVMLAASHGKSEVFDMMMKKGADLSVIDKNGDNILHWACRGGNVKIVNYILIQNTLDINSKGYEDKTPVMLAASHGKNEVFNILMKKGADLSVTDDDGHNILHCACRGGNVNIVSYILIQSSLDINSKCHDEMTPVMHAASLGKNEVFDILVKNGANLSDTDVDGSTILCLACRGGNVEIVNYILMQNIVDINRKNIDGKTPVVCAAHDGNREVFDILVKKGVNLSVTDQNGDNVLHWACRGGKIKIVNYILMQTIVDINSNNGWGMTPVMSAALHGRREVFDVLVEKGANISVVDEDGDNILHFACLGADENILQHILRLNLVDINYRGSNGMTALLLAAQHNAHYVFKLLLNSGADPSVVNSDGNNVLHFACKADDEEIVKHVLQLHLVDINCRGSNGMTPLLLAARYNTIGAFELLLENGADPSVVNSYGNNALHFACIGGNEDIVKHVIKLHLVDINCRGYNEMTPLLLAAERSASGIFEMLLDNGADPSVVNSDGNNALHFACIADDEEIVKHVLKLHLVDINSRGSNEMTPLLLAAEKSAPDVFKILLDSGADPSVVNSDGNNALHFACMADDEEIVKHVLKLHLVDINSRGSNEMTPLLLAAEKSAPDVFKMLLDSGADPSVVNSDGNNVLHFACMADDEEIVKHVLKLHLVDINSRGSNEMTPLLLAAEKSAPDVFKMLLDSGADPSVVNSDGNNVLHFACMADDEEIVKHVLKLHLVDINSRGSNEMTPLLLAAEKSAPDVFKMLLDSGADPSVVNSDGNNVLHFACMADDEEIVKHVLKLHLVDINSRGSNEMTPLLLAAEKSAPDVFKMLLDSGADPSVVNSDGNNVLHFACMADDEEIVKHVLKLHLVDIKQCT